VLGKFYALATLLFIPVAIISIYPLVLSAFGEISLAETYLAVGAFFLYGLACIAIGEFVSSITESQMIAAIISFGILFAGYVMNAICNMISSTGNWLTKLLSAFDMSGRFDELMNGSLSLASCVYFLSIILLFLIFSLCFRLLLLTCRGHGFCRFPFATRMFAYWWFMSLISLCGWIRGEVPRRDSCL